MESGRRNVGIEQVESTQVVNTQSTKNVLEKQFVIFALQGATSPTVENVEKLQFRNTAPVTIVDFKNGQNGQQVTVLGDGFTTVAENAKIANASGSDTFLDIGSVHIYTRFPDGKWHELAGGVSGGVKLRLLSFPFGDGVAMVDVGTYRPLFINSVYSILHWYIEAFDTGGLPIAASATFDIHRIKGAVVTDAVGVGTKPTLTTSIQSGNDTSTWVSATGTAEETIRAMLATCAPAGATFILLTLIVQTAA